MPGGRCAPWSVIAIGLLAIGCGNGDSGGNEEAEWAELDPCGGSGHPCMLAEVDGRARARTESLAEAVGEQLGSPDDLQQAAEWLARQDGVVSVATGPEAIRFRVRGGRGRWILVRTLESSSVLGAPTMPKPPHRGADPSHVGSRQTRAGEPFALAATASLTGSAQRTSTNGRTKGALLLSPFRWQWEVQGDSDGLDEVKTLLKARDYRDGVKLWTERLDPANEACREGAVRWKDCRTIGEMGSPTAYTTWREYNFVYLMTHGAAVRDRKNKTTKTGILTSWTVDDVKRERAEAENDWFRPGNDVDFIDRIGLERGSVFVWGVGVDEIPLAGDGQQAEVAYPLKVIVQAEKEGPVPLNSALSAGERSLCRHALNRKPDSERIREASRRRTERIAEGAAEERQSRFAHMDALARVNGNICGAYSKRVKTGPFIMLTTPFFEETYPGGIDDAVILISACSSGASKDLLNALAGKNTSVVGWSQSVGIGAAAAAGKLIAQKLVQVDENVEDDSGLSVGQAIQAVRDLIDEHKSRPPLSEDECRNPSPESAAQCALQHGTRSPLTVINDRPADPLTGAMLTVVGDTAIRAREIVYLVDEVGGELQGGATLPLVGTAGDGSADSVDLTIRVDGLGLEGRPRDVGLRVHFEGRPIDVDRELESEVADGVWQLDYRLPLGRDARGAELVDFEIEALLAGHKNSRWLYEDLRLVGLENAHQFVVSGDVAGSLDGRMAVNGVPMGGGRCYVQLWFLSEDGNPVVHPSLKLEAVLQKGVIRGEFAFGRDPTIRSDIQDMMAVPDVFFANLGTRDTREEEINNAFRSRSGTLTISRAGEGYVAGAFSLELEEIKPWDLGYPRRASVRGRFVAPLSEEGGMFGQGYSCRPPE